jgi:hypothetical protein
MHFVQRRTIIKIMDPVAVARTPRRLAVRRAPAAGAYTPPLSLDMRADQAAILALKKAKSCKSAYTGAAAVRHDHSQTLQIIFF